MRTCVHVCVCVLLYIVRERKERKKKMKKKRCERSHSTVNEEKCRSVFDTQQPTTTNNNQQQPKQHNQNNNNQKQPNETYMKTKHKSAVYGDPCLTNSNAVKHKIFARNEIAPNVFLTIFKLTFK